MLSVRQGRPEKSDTKEEKPNLSGVVLQQLDNLSLFPDRAKERIESVNRLHPGAEAAAKEVPFAQGMTEALKISISPGWQITTGRVAVDIASRALMLATTWVAAKIPVLAVAAQQTGGATEVEALHHVVAGSGILGIATFTLLWAGGRLEAIARPVSSRNLDKTVLNRASELSQPVLENPETQNRLTKIRENTLKVDTAANGVLQLIPQTAGLVMGGLAVLPVSPLFSGFLLGIGVLSIYHGYRYGRESSLAADVLAESRRGVWYKSAPLRDTLGLAELKHLGKAGQLTAEFDRDERNVSDASLVPELRNYSRLFVTGVFSQVALASASAYGIYAFLSQSITLEQGLFLGGATASFSGTLSAFIRNVTSIISTYPYVHELCVLENMARETRDREAEVTPDSVSRWTEAPGIELRDLSASVWITDPSNPAERKEKQLLEKINLQINPGEMIGIVGAPGAGKTSLVKALIGALPVSHGEILIGSRDLAQLPLAEFRANTSFLPQIFWNYPGRTIRENIELGNSLWNDSGSVEDIIRQSGLDQMMRENGFNLDTVSSPEFRNGRLLSGGESQMVALSRALMKRGSLIILDEPTSRLDPSTSDLVLNHLREIQGATRLLISHDMGLVRQCDRIVVIARSHGEDGPGIIQAFGTHEQVLQNSPIYRRFYLAQASRFEEQHF